MEEIDPFAASWETAYFDFDEDSLLTLADNAARLGVELLVLDDGWFGRRDNDRCSLGDWTENRRKLPHGLPWLAREINRRGLLFGLWLEPEMINEDSDLYRAHPDWIQRVPGYEPLLCHSQMVLDLCNPDVVEYLFGAISRLLSEAPIAYVKWDMNRPLSCLGSPFLPAQRQGEVSHRYVLALYSLLARLTERFPHVLFEGCSGGGGRFDLGMLCYCPQIWASDDTDPIERLSIQNGTSYAYPAETMGGHVSASPNHLTKRATPFAARAAAALMGTFGYELDLGSLSAEEQAAVRVQIEQYHRFYPVIHEGTLYRLAEPDGRQPFVCWQFVSPDRRESLAIVLFFRTVPNMRSFQLRLRGLLPDVRYGSEDGSLSLHGDTLCRCGCVIPVPALEGNTWLLHLTAEEDGVSTDL